MRGIAAGFALAMTVKPNALAILATLVAFAHCVRSAEDNVVVLSLRANAVSAAISGGRKEAPESGLSGTFRLL